jgi:putative phosphonate metabolism protein
LRYAIYFSPAAEHPLTQAAARWLGRDAFSGESFTQPVVDGIAEADLQALTVDPRRYGFHATLKAPFELAEGRSEAELMDAVGQYASATAAFEIPNLVLGQLGRFFALVPDHVYPPLQRFAADVVGEFEPFRAPLSPADLERRRPDQLSPEHRANLLHWGYPYVMDEFRFHMTLTGQVPPERSPAIRAELEERFGAFINRPLLIDGIALFREPERGGDFAVHHWLPLAPPSQRERTTA